MKVNPWPWLTSRSAAEDMAEKVAEWPEKYGSLANLEWAVGQPAVKRIGHAIAARSAEPNLFEEMKIRNITVEVRSIC